ncbi:LytR/AlgR family response regulator transcription factor [Chitinophaga sp. 22620]|uniref:LytR/AlgR family response regulator transcription factor n=1 Tax=Chitinophaga sp. 22620 TaxID=3453952 RepID=UPI003F877B80
MKMRCLIIDDEPLAHDVILKYIEDTPFLELAGQCYRATEALEFLNRQPVDLLFLDIRMPRLNGLEFLRTLHQRPLVIITSAYEEYALQGFELAVCDYLLKPFRFDRFLQAVNRAYAQFNQTQPLPSSSATPQNPAQLAVKTDKKLVFVDLQSVFYLESLGNYVKVWQENTYLLTARTLSSYETELPADTFVRIHKSYILNRKMIHALEGNIVHLRNGKQLPLGKNYKHAVNLK